MLAKITSGAIKGVDGYIVSVEVDISNGLPAFDIVGLPDSAVKESRERVTVAIKNIGLNFPMKRITVNLAPADIRKEGPSFDLPIAVGILVCMGVIPATAVENVFMVGELSLDAHIRTVNGVLPMVYSAERGNAALCVVPPENRNEAALVRGIRVIAPLDLSMLIAHFNNASASCEPDAAFDTASGSRDAAESGYILDYRDVRGQENVKRALEIGAAGRHNIILIGPPGSGKTMMAKRLPGILPDLTFEESIEITKIYSVAGLLPKKFELSGLISKRPFRAPHHTISNAALVGGGRIPSPGEISLAHLGVLFLDELTEFNRNVLEAMRQPLEEGSVNISRVHGSITYPADFMLVGAMNPCPCGFFGIPDKCTCSQNEISKYLSRISGPLLDRIDIQAEAAAVKYKELDSAPAAENSPSIRKRVLSAMNIQHERYKKENIRSNSELTVELINKYCSLDSKSRELLERAFSSLKLSARAYHKILKMARTIADLENASDINVRHISEAIGYRGLDRKYW